MTRRNKRRTRLQNTGTSSIFEALELVQKEKARFEKEVRRLTRKIRGLNSDVKRLKDINVRQEIYINDIEQKLNLLEIIRKQQEERIKNLEHEKEVMINRERKNKEQSVRRTNSFTTHENEVHGNEACELFSESRL
ncbi:hypothetical protein F8M41_011176 [Gigaspora margarita]|uniref:Uncharacterized protein n=1 Tax=Gigaspora margarita TaxID=4874 RepID=A0A8H3WZH2_GIGMA|nr:hypothetical protein F8M41_011176 [Gigaspora margarita]